MLLKYDLNQKNNVKHMYCINRAIDNSYILLNYNNCESSTYSTYFLHISIL